EPRVDRASVEIDRAHLALLDRIVTVISYADIDSIAEHQRCRVAHLFVQRVLPSGNESRDFVRRLPNQRTGRGVQREDAATALTIAEFSAWITGTAAIRALQNDERAALTT